MHLINHLSRILILFYNMDNNNNKVGLITYYGNNYGGCLQAYAIQETLRNLGKSPYILQVYTPLKHLKSTRWNKLFKIVINPIAFFKRRKYITKHIQNDKLRSEAFNRYRKEYLIFDKTFTLTTDNLNIANQYNTFVCGSDQIWNPHLYGVHPIWTLKFAPKNSTKIAYAPSLGVSSIPDEYVSDFKNNLKDYTYLSCREEEGANCLSKILNKDVDVVLDPTLLLTPEQWKNFEKPVNIKKPYIFCYLFGDYPYIAEIKKKVKQYLKLDIVCLPYNLRELKSSDIKLYDITPNQFVWLIDNAQYVITDSFHASVFSIKMSTPFISLKRTSDNDIKNMNSRLYTLLRTVELEDRIISENMGDIIGKIIDKQIDFEKANNKLSKYMSRDITKLKNALSHE